MALKYFATMGDFSEWHPCLFAMTQHIPAVNGLPLVNHFVESQIQLRLQRTAGKAQKADMISDFMPLETIDSDPEKAHRSLRHLCETNILPGADTTATAICAAIFYLSQSPESTERLRQELEAVGDGLADDAAEKLPGPRPYLQAVVQEAMRLHSPVGLTLPRVVPEGGSSICGHHFAAGVSASSIPSQLC
jgi:cytochrome P450